MHDAFDALAGRAANVEPFPLEVLCQYDASFQKQLTPSERPTNFAGARVYPPAPPREGPVWVIFRRYAKEDKEKVDGDGWVDAHRRGAHVAGLGSGQRRSGGLSETSRENAFQANREEALSRLTLGANAFQDLLADFNVVPTLLSRADAARIYRLESDLPADMGGKRRGMDFVGFCTAVVRIAAVSFASSVPSDEYDEDGGANALHLEGASNPFLARAQRCISLFLSHLGAFNSNSRRIAVAIDRFERFSGDRSVRASRRRWEYVAANQRMAQIRREQVQKSAAEERRLQAESSSAGDAAPRLPKSEQSKRKFKSPTPDLFDIPDIPDARSPRIIMEKVQAEFAQSTATRDASRQMMHEAMTRVEQSWHVARGHPPPPSRTNDIHSVQHIAAPHTHAHELTRTLALSLEWRVPVLLVRRHVLRHDATSIDMPQWHYFPQPRTLDMGAILRGQARDYRIVLRYRGERIAKLSINMRNLPPNTAAHYSEAPLVTGMPRVIDLHVPFDVVGEWLGEVNIACSDSGGGVACTYTVPVYARCVPRAVGSRTPTPIVFSNV